MGSPLNSNVPEGISMFRSRSGSRELFKGHFIAWSGFADLVFHNIGREILLSTKNLLQ
jgi:hypothetical protein